MRDLKYEIDIYWHVAYISYIYIYMYIYIYIYIHTFKLIVKLTLF